MMDALTRAGAVRREKDGSWRVSEDVCACSKEGRYRVYEYCDVDVDAENSDAEERMSEDSEDVDMDSEDSDAEAKMAENDADAYVFPDAETAAQLLEDLPDEDDAEDAEVELPEAAGGAEDDSRVQTDTEEEACFLACGF